MPTTLTFEEHGAGIGEAATVLRANAGAAGLDAPVPTCPGWTVRDLVVHQGMVHRWTTDTVSGREVGDGEEHAAAGRDSSDLLGWFDDGATALLQALAGAPPDLDVWFVLLDGGPPRDAWARRQSHETTIHAVDAMAARLGRMPTAKEVWFSRELAVDGIDELLLGFLPRSRARLRTEEPLAILVDPDDSSLSWQLRTSTEPPVVTLGSGPADATFSGTATEVYLGLWNRGEAMRSSDEDVLELWRRVQKVSW